MSVITEGPAGGSGHRGPAGETAAWGPRARRLSGALRFRRSSEALRAGTAAGSSCWVALQPFAAVDAAPDSAPHPLSRELLEAVLADRTTDRFVCELVWPRLGYARDAAGRWCAGPSTEARWREIFPVEPQFIAERPPSVALTRSIAKEHKQLLKEQLAFAGYRIGELYPRRTRRATAVNWLLAHLAERGEPLPEAGPLPELLEMPADPGAGHPGDLPVR